MGQIQQPQVQLQQSGVGGASAPPTGTATVQQVTSNSNSYTADRLVSDGITIIVTTLRFILLLSPSHSHDTTCTAIIINQSHLISRFNNNY